MTDVRIEPLSAENVAAWDALFERAASPCFCRWWHFEGKKNDWLARCALHPEENRAEAEAAVRANEPSGIGLVAMNEATCVAWMKIAPRASVPKLRGLPIYRALDLGPDEGVWSIGCFLVDPARRNAGIAGALLDAAPELVRSRGGTAIEAYPRHLHESAHPVLHDEEVLMGPESMYVRRGYARVAEDKTMPMYPVYRLPL